MLNNIKNTFSPKPQLLQYAAQGKQTNMNGARLTLRSLWVSLASLYIGQLGLMMAIIIPMTIYYAIKSTDISQISELYEGETTVIVNLFATIAPIIILMLYVKLAEKRPISSMGFVKKHAVSDYIIGMAAAFVMFTACVAICIATGAMSLDGLVFNGSYLSLALIFVGFLIQGMSEETLCRGFMMTSVGSKLGAPFAVLLNSVLFGALHLGNNGVTMLSMLNLILFGVFMSVVVLKLNSIWMVCAIHSIWNFVQGHFYGVPVSGMTIYTTVFKVSSIEGMELFNGGSFGMEGGLATTIVLTIGIIIFLCIKPRTDKQENA